MILLIFFFLSLLIFCCLFLNTVTILNMAKKSKNYYKYFSNFFIRIELSTHKNWGFMILSAWKWGIELAQGVGMGMGYKLSDINITSSLV